MLKRNTRKIDYRLHCAGWRKLKEHLSYNLDGANLLTKRAMDIYEEFLNLWHKKWKHEAVIYSKSEVMAEIGMSGKSSTTWCDAVRRLEVIGLIKVQPYKNQNTYKSICRLTPLDNIYRDWKAEFTLHTANGGKEFILIDFERIKAEQYKGFERASNKSKYFDIQQQKLFGIKPKETQRDQEQTTESEKAKQAMSALFEQMRAREEENEHEEETPVRESITLRENHEELSHGQKQAIFFCETLNEEMYAHNIEPFELKNEQITAMEYLIDLAAEMEHNMVENARRWVSTAANSDDNLRGKFKPTILIPHYHCEILNALRFSVGLAPLQISRKERMDMNQLENICHEKGLKITDFFASAAKGAKKDKELAKRFTPAFLKGAWFERFEGDTYKDNPNVLSNGAIIPQDYDGGVFMKKHELNHERNRADRNKVKALWISNGWENINGTWRKKNG